MIFIITPRFLPSIKAGGPAISVARICQVLDQGSYCVYTSGRDLDGDAYSNEAKRSVTEIFGQVVYGSRGSIFFRWLRDRLRGEKRTVYINTLFSFFWCILPVLVYGGGENRIIIAPRGQLDPGAMSHKTAHKRLFLKIFGCFFRSKNVAFHCTAPIELDNLLTVFPEFSSKCVVIPNIGPAVERLGNVGHQRDIDLCFVSRINRKKNLLFLLRALSEFRVPCKVHIYGPLEDVEYWEECLNVVRGLPKNIEFCYGGILERDEVIRTIGRSKIFVLPTLGENFGHIILDALCAGTPVVLSPFTPWVESGNGVIRTLELSEDVWKLTLECVLLNYDSDIHSDALAYAKHYLGSDNSRDLTRAFLTNQRVV